MSARERGPRGIAALAESAPIEPAAALAPPAVGPRATVVAPWMRPRPPLPPAAIVAATSVPDAPSLFAGAPVLLARPVAV